MLAERIEALDRRLGESLKDTATKTAETLGGIQTRLTVIDEAQKNISALSGTLSGQVVSLQEIFSNKQARGLFGQTQMEAIIADALPPGSYEFQATLSNGSRPDCVIRMPGIEDRHRHRLEIPAGILHGLERGAGEAERKAAAAAVRSDMLKHVKDIAEKYLLPGETQTPAIMFVPSESIYAELHENFPDVIQRSQRAQVIVVSPNILMLAITTVQTVMKDARMREQANLIQKEVGVLLRRREAAGRARGQSADAFQPGGRRHQGHRHVDRESRQTRRRDRSGRTGSERTREAGERSSKVLTPRSPRIRKGREGISRAKRADRFRRVSIERSACAIARKCLRDLCVSLATLALKNLGRRTTSPGGL